MSDNIEIARARRAAYDACRDQWEWYTPRETIDDAFRDVEMQVVRTLLSRLLPDGEVGFWRLVEEEVRRWVSSMNAKPSGVVRAGSATASSCRPVSGTATASPRS